MTQPRQSQPPRASRTLVETLTIWLAILAAIGLLLLTPILARAQGQSIELVRQQQIRVRVTASQHQSPFTVLTRPRADHQFLDRTNLALFSADFLVRSLDAQSTRANLTNPCQCFREQNTPWVSSTTARQYSYSLGVAAANVGLAWLAHRTRHHRLERLLAGYDIPLDGEAVVHNWVLGGEVVRSAASVVGPTRPITYVPGGPR